MHYIFSCPASWRLAQGRQCAGSESDNGAAPECSSGFALLFIYLGLGAMTSGRLDPSNSNMAAPLLARAFGDIPFAMISAIAVGMKGAKDSRRSRSGAWAPPSGGGRQQHTSGSSGRLPPLRVRRRSNSRLRDCVT